MTGNRIRQNVEGGGEWGGHADLAVWENDIEKVRQILAGMNPGKVRTAGQTYTAVANRMHTTVELLYNQATKMAEAWSGEPAKRAMENMQKTYTQANEIYSKSYQSGGAMTRHADMMQSYKDNPPEEAGGGGFMGGVMDVASAVSPAVAGGRAVANNEIADQFMERLQNDTASSNDGFPDTIRQNMANPGVAGFDPNTGGGGGGLPGGGGGSVGGGGLPGGGSPGGGGLPGGGDFPSGGSLGGGGLPGGGDFPGGGSLGGGGLPDGGVGGPGTDLAGVGGGPGGGLGGGGLGGGAGLGGGSAGGGGLPGGGVGGVGGVMGGPGGGVGGGVGGGSASGKGGSGRAGGIGGAPMGAGGGRGEGEEERERSTWLTEDEDVWGSDGDAAPPVIG